MLSRAPLIHTLAPGQLSTWTDTLKTGPASGLLRVIVILAAIAVVACVNLAQANAIDDVMDDTRVLDRTIVALEGTNWLLIDQVAQWTSPEHVEQRATLAGLKPAESVTTLALSTVSEPAPVAGTLPAGVLAQVHARTGDVTLAPPASD